MSAGDVLPANVRRTLEDPERFWRRAATALEQVPPDQAAAPPTAKIGAVLVLVADRDHGPELVLTRRRADMRSHPGQVSFPGGRVDEGETIVEAALREANEEVDLDPESVEIVGPGPVFYIPPSRFWVAPVLARWVRPHALDRNPWEVDAILHVPVADLVDPQRWRAVPLSAGGASWAWQLDDDVLWGATAITVHQLLEVVLPGWRNGVEAAALPAGQQLRPWEDIPRVPPRRLLDGELPARASSAAPRVDVATARRLWSRATAVGWGLGEMAEQAGRGVAHAVRRLHAPGSLAAARVTVAAGPGGTGAVGLVAARLLAAAGADVEVLLTGRDGAVALPGQLALLETAGIPVVPAARRLGDRGPGDVFVDAMVGMGAVPPLRDAAAEVADWLRGHACRVLAVDLPSGLGGDAGLRGPGVTADVTVTLGALKEGMLPAIVQPYLGDLYLADLGIPPALWQQVDVVVTRDLFADGPLVRLVPDDVASDAGTPDQGGSG